MEGKRLVFDSNHFVEAAPGKQDETNNEGGGENESKQSEANLVISQSSFHCLCKVCTTKFKQKSLH